MPFRTANAYASYDYAGFGSPGPFPYSYDLGSDGFMSPYVVPMVSPQTSC